MRLIIIACLLLTGCATTPALTCPRPEWPAQPRYPLLDLKPEADDATVMRSYVATVQGQQDHINKTLKPFFKSAT
jgi:uncharacterized protein YceK